MPFAGRVGGNQHFAISPKKSPAPLPFAGRLGANQGSIVQDDRLGDDIEPLDQAHQAGLLDKTPDASPLRTPKDVLDLKGFTQPIIWRSTVIECWGTFCLVFTVGLIANAIAPYSHTNPLAVALVGSLTNWIAITLFVYATAPASGGHLNPLITMSTFAAGLSTLPRSLLYIVAQCIGAIGAGFFLKLGLESSDFYSSGIVAGCTIETSLISYGEAYVLEAGTALVVIFVAFGVGLDPRQGQVLGPALSPVLVGLTVGLSTFGTGIVREGWYGASLNPARCLGQMTAKQELHAHWIHWLAAMTASAVNGLLYHCIPPYHDQI